jgi:hypothetical protein
MEVCGITGLQDRQDLQGIRHCEERSNPAFFSFRIASYLPMTHALSVIISGATKCRPMRDCVISVCHCEQE